MRVTTDGENAIARERERVRMWRERDGLTQRETMYGYRGELYEGRERGHHGHGERGREREREGESRTMIVQLNRAVVTMKRAHMYCGIEREGVIHRRDGGVSQEPEEDAWRLYRTIRRLFACVERSEMAYEKE